MWDKIVVGNGREESKCISSTTLDCEIFQTRTVVTLSSSEGVQENPPSICCTSSSNNVVLAVDSEVHVFREECSLVCTLTLESQADCLSLSKDSELLVIGESNGILHAFHVSKHAKLWSLLLVNKEDGDANSFQGALVYKDDSDRLKIFILTSKKKLIVFYNISSAEINEAVDLGYLQEIAKDVLREEVDLPDIYPRLVPNFIYENMADYENPICITGGGRNGIADRESYICGISVFNSDTPGLGIEKAFHTVDDHVIVLDTNHQIRIICANTFTTIRVWETDEVHDFVVNEVEDPDNFSSLEMRMGMLVKAPGTNVETRHFKIVMYPSFETIYSVEVHHSTVLASCAFYQDQMYVIETESDAVDGQVSSVVLKSVSQPSFEARFSSLLHKRKYKEAEKFADAHHLDHQLIYKTKVGCIFKQLTGIKYNGMRNENPDFNSLLGELKDNLFKVQDLAYLKMCLNIHLPLLEQTAFFFQLCQHWLQEKAMNEKAGRDLLCKINSELNRSLTYELLRINKCTTCEWREFLTVNLNSEFLNGLKQGNFPVSLMLWRRHQDELLSNLDPDKVQEVLLSVPSFVPSDDLISFLQNDFLSPLLIKLPSVVDLVVNWLIQRMHLLEDVEKDKWPENGKQLLEVFLYVNDFHSGDFFSKGRFDYSTYLNSYSIHARNLDENSSIRHLHVFIQNLTQLICLKQRFNCKISLSDYSEKNKMTVLFSILDRLNVSDIPEAMNTFGKMFVLGHDLALDNCFHKYIEKVLQKSSCTWWHGEEAPWEKRLLTVVQLIQDTHSLLDAIILITSMAPIPWSEGVQKLVETGMSLQHPNKDILKIQFRLARLKKVLIKYQLQDVPIDEDTEMAEYVVMYILKQHGLSAMKDVMDVLQAYENLLPDAAFLSVLCHLLDIGETDKLMALLTELPLEVSVKHCNLLHRFIISNLDDEDIIKMNRQYCSTLAQTSLSLIRYMRSIGLAVEPEVQLHLRSMDKLQREFGLFFPISLLSSDCHCWALVEEMMETVIDGKPRMHQDDDRNSSPVKISANRILRLGELLLLEREDVITRLVFVHVRKQKYEEAIILCKQLSSSYSSQTIASTLVKVVEHIFLNFKDIEKLELIAIVDTIHKLICQVVTYCDYDQLWSYQLILSQAHILNEISRLTIRDSQLMVSEVGESVYKGWRFTPVYSDEGLWVDADRLHMFFSKAFTNVVFHGSEGNSHDIDTESIMKDTVAMMKHLRDKGQEVSAVSVMFHALSLLSLHMTGQKDNNSALSDEVLSCTSDVLTTNSITIFQKAIQQRIPDLPFLLGILNMLPIKEVIHSFKKLVKRCCINTKQVLTLYAVAVEFSLEQRALPIAHELSKSWEQINWIYKHSKSSISAEEVLNLSCKQQFNMIEGIISSQDIDLDEVALCCSSFGLDHDDILIIYLQNLLIGSQVSRWSAVAELPEQEVELLLKKADCALMHFAEPKLAFKFLKNIFNHVNPYYYELLLFIQEKLTQLCETLDIQNKREIFVKNISVLKFLLVYKRSAAPIQGEKELWIAGHFPNNELPLVAQSRLPFHALMGTAMHKIINPELTADSAKVWLSVASFLNLDPDQLIMIAVKNAVSSYMAQRPSELMRFIPDMNFFPILHNLLLQIESFDMAAACAVSVTNMMPCGATKVVFSKGILHIIKQHKRMPKHAEASNIIRKCSTIHKNAAIECILFKYDLSTEDCVSKIKHPEKLIMYLIENFCNSADKSIKVCKVANEISKSCELNLFEICFNYLCQSLKPSLEVSMDDSFMFKEDEDALTDSKKMADRQNLKKAIYFASGLPESLRIQLLKSVLTKFSELSYIHKARVLCCLSSVSTPNMVYEVVGTNISELADQLKVITCLAELEKLHLPYSIKVYIKCDKLEVVQRILSCHSHNPKALICCVKICLEYKLWDDILWQAILKGMQSLSMIDELYHVLHATGEDLLHIWHHRFFVDAWYAVISSALEAGNQGASPEEILHKVDQMLLRCPCLSLINSSALWVKSKEYKIVSASDEFDGNLCTSIQRLFLGIIDENSGVRDSLDDSFAVIPSGLEDNSGLQCSHNGTSC